MSVRLRIPAACLALLLLPGCNLAIAGALVQPLDGVRPEASQAAKPTVFNLLPSDHVPAVSAAARAAAAWPADNPVPALGMALPGASVDGAALAAGAAGERVNIVKLVGRAHVSQNARGIANVREGLVAGSPVRVVDAQTGKTLSTAISFYDGSFSLDVKFRSAASAVLLTTELIDAKDPTLKATLSAPVYLRAADAQRDVQITPGTTALTSFLQAVAAMQSGAPGVEGAKAAMPQDATALAAVSGPQLSSLIVAMKDDEQTAFSRLASSSPDVANADSVTALRAAIMKLMGRLNVKKAD